MDKALSQGRVSSFIYFLPPKESKVIILGVGEVRILTLLLIGCVFLGLSLYLSEASLSHLSYGWVSDSVASEGLQILTTSTVFSKTKMLTHDLTKAFMFLITQRVYLKSLIRSTKMKAVNGHYVGPFHVFSFNDRTMRLLKSGKGGQLFLVHGHSCLDTCAHSVFMHLECLLLFLPHSKSLLSEVLFTRLFPQGLPEICLNHSFGSTQLPPDIFYVVA